jgi:proline iminopeptidase
MTRALPEPAAVHDGLAIYALGSGQPVFFVPGPHRFQRVGTRTGDALIDGLIALGRRVVTYDPPGSGRSTRPPHLSMVEMVTCADEALAVSGVAGPMDVLGHSMGGLAALAFVLERPEAVRRLVLAGTGSGGPAYMNAPGALWHRGHPGFTRMAALGIVARAWPRRGPERLLMNLVERESFVDHTLARPRPVSAQDWLRPREGRPDWHGIARRIDFAPRLAEVRSPTLVLCGRRDPQFPLACSEQLATGIPGARLVVFERSGHYPFIEEAAAFWSQVGEFLSAAVAAPGA